MNSGPPPSRREAYCADQPRARRARFTSLIRSSMSATLAHSRKVSGCPVPQTEAYNAASTRTVAPVQRSRKSGPYRPVVPRKTSRLAARLSGAGVHLSPAPAQTCSSPQRVAIPIVARAGKVRNPLPPALRRLVPRNTEAAIRRKVPFTAEFMRFGALTTRCCGSEHRLPSYQPPPCGIPRRYSIGHHNDEKHPHCCTLRPWGWPPPAERAARVRWLPHRVMTLSGAGRQPTGRPETKSGSGRSHAGRPPARPQAAADVRP